MMADHESAIYSFEFQDVRLVIVDHEVLMTEFPRKIPRRYEFLIISECDEYTISILPP
jgi:hypothetical protein